MTDRERIYQTFLFCEGGWRTPKWIMAVYVGPIWVKGEADVRR